MPKSYEYQPTIGHDTDPEDDLDLDELDYATAGANGHSKSTRQSPWRTSSTPQSQSVPLRSLNDSSPHRFWQTKNKRRRHHQSDDLEGLLDDGFDEESRGWNVRKSDRPVRAAKPIHSRQSSLRQSIQYSRDFVKQELAGIRDEPDASSKDSREVDVGRQQKKKYPANIVSNAKYTLWSFLPLTLYNEFRFFLNIYFLLVALSQIIPYLRIGYMSTYIVPLAFVLTISIGKEAFDDLARRRRDAEANSEPYTVLAFDPDSAVRPTPLGAREAQKKSRDLKVGDILKLEKNQRVPADVVLLKSTAAEAVVEGPAELAAGDTVAAETFIRTDQLDGETDWKLRIPCPPSQGLSLADLRRLQIIASAPNQKVTEFVGTATLSARASAYDPHVAKQQDEGESPRESSPSTTSIPLGIDNTAWANTVLASNTTTLAVIIYTGKQTRSAMSTSQSRSKSGLLESEINTLTKILCVMTLTLSVVLVALEGFEPSNKKPWYVATMIYLILFSTIIPISLRVNLDMGKTVYAYFIERDQGIPGTVVRTSTIPEDLGRIEYLLSDKTGTLTQNEMQLKKIHVGTVSYAGEAMEEVTGYVNQVFAQNTEQKQLLASMPVRSRREIGTRVRDLIVALAICHNVTPSTEEIDGEQIVSYQASSPDEIAIVEFTEAVGLRLQQRTREEIILQSTQTDKTVLTARILDIFPFTSDSKRMGIIVKVSSTIPDLPLNDELVFFQKGADTVMSTIVAANDWLNEETANMAREGLRTLVVGRKKLSQAQYDAFASAYQTASLSLHNRDTQMSSIVASHLEHNLDLLGVTGVEDRLQRDVKPSLELLRNAGVKIWMLTGDKVETARCVAVSARLVARGQSITTIAKIGTKAAAIDALDSIRNRSDTALLIDGESLAIMLTHLRTQFITLAVTLPAVIASRCSPTQKAEVAILIRTHTKKRVCCIGDGGNDVSMIQAADVGIGIVGKEGRQASLAADFSVTQFCHVTKLLVWHGRNSYKRSAKLAQFIIHRGLIISVCQTMYNIAGKFDPKGLFKDWLLVGYATVYTMAPVFSLVLDRDVDEKLANLYPELYKELKTGQSLSYKTFFTWVAVSIYQGIVIQGLSQLLVGAVDGPRMLSVSFTVLVLNELIMVAVSVTTWHPIMIVSILGTGALYAASVPFLGAYFDLQYVASLGWVWRVAVVAAISLVPVWSGKLIGRAVRPPSYRKVQGR
ncbi:putative aminophospholipid-translocase [Exophiala xenobiotica]|uniref:Phospholipid-transporting ATPase n=1 Tax=Lithohypha guttulata TaxID=1690604 RepID=A0ABR0KF93_9EURO|nr:putative aminophospholipid-translocase [Lithohypha guttulata]KAK5322259.1 putative aminophospholipid-translocase [Exophiala xenobiotica]